MPKAKVMTARAMTRRGKRSVLAKYTERCLNALDLRAMPPCVYVPYGLRREVRIDFDGVATKELPDATENVLRVARADPVGLLIGMLQGQPIPVYRLTREGDHFVVSTDLEVPDLELRANIAVELTRMFKKPRKATGELDYEAMIQRMADEEITPATRQGASEETDPSKDV